jgi:hypothetical protein
MADLAREDLTVFLVFHGFAALHKDFSVFTKDRSTELIALLRCS